MLRRARPGLGTLVEIAIEPAAAFDAARMFDAAFALVESLEAQLSAHRIDSELSHLCRNAHFAPQRPGVAVRDVLRTALDLYRQSQGIFDVARPPRNGSTSAACSSADIELRDDGSLFFWQPLRIDLGGIAKGYVIDRVVEQLQQSGARSGQVNAGGDLRVFGSAAEPVALRFADGFRMVAVVTEGAFAASRPGPRPMSIAAAVSDHYDGRDRHPVETADTLAVFAPCAMLADALTKIALVCPVTMDRLGETYSAQWRRYPFTLDTHSTLPQTANAA